MSLQTLAQKNVVTVSPGANLLDAAVIMRERHVGDLVVVKASSSVGKQIPVGILTDRDIVVSTVAFGLDPKSVTVQEVMGSQLRTAKITDGVYDILELMQEYGIKRVPLVDAEGSLAGIITADDLISILAREMTGIAKITDQQKNVELIQRRKFA